MIYKGQQNKGSTGSAAPRKMNLPENVIANTCLPGNLKENPEEKHIP
jgi:hypothetical protein